MIHFEMPGNWLGMVPWALPRCLWLMIAVGLLGWTARRGNKAFILSIAALFLLFLQAGNKKALELYLLSLFPALCLGYSRLGLGKPSSALLVGFGGQVLGTLIYMGCLVAGGMNLLIHPVERWFAAYCDYALQTFVRLGLEEYYAAQGITAKTMAEVFAYLKEGLAHLRYSLYVYEGWVSILIGWWGLKVADSQKMKTHTLPFYLQKMPWQLSYVAILGLAFWLLGKEWQLIWATVVGANMICLIAPVSFYFGLALVMFLIKVWKIESWMVFILLVLALSVPVQTFLVLVVVGLFDSLLDLRKIEKLKGGSS